MKSKNIKYPLFSKLLFVIVIVSNGKHSIMNIGLDIGSVVSSRTVLLVGKIKVSDQNLRFDIATDKLYHIRSHDLATNSQTQTFSGDRHRFYT